MKRILRIWQAQQPLIWEVVPKSSSSITHFTEDLDLEEGELTPAAQLSSHLVRGTFHTGYFPKCLKYTCMEQNVWQFLLLLANKWLYIGQNPVGDLP
jgi:hypothetical protein